MDIDENTVAQVAKVARLNLSKEEEKRFGKELREVITTFSKLSEVDTKGTEPSFHPIPLKGVPREDTVAPSLDDKDALALATHKKDSYFKGPKVMS